MRYSVRTLGSIAALVSNPPNAASRPDFQDVLRFPSPQPDVHT